MSARVTLLLGLLLSGGGVGAQSLVRSPRPDHVAVTVYRAPYGNDGDLQLGWLQGFALVSETRHVSLPAGESELRFEGVAGGLVPPSALVDGLGDAVIEKNRDARLLSPGNLLDASLGRLVHLRRTSRATGKVEEQDAVVRSTAGGIVIQSAGGIEALRCTGLAETLRPASVPADLASTPTLSVRVRAPHAVEADVRLTYLASGFDWRASYVATPAPDGRHLALAAWLTMANGDDTGFANADALAVAGKVNHQEGQRLAPSAPPISISCWPSQTTSDIPVDEVADRYPATAPPPPPSAVRLEGMISDIVVTGARVQAEREQLGDLKLYRIPIPVTVAAHSQKQVSLLDQPDVKVELIHRYRTRFDNRLDQPATAEILLRTRNRKQDGLGLPLPSGRLVLYADRGGAPFLLGEGKVDDKAEGEKVDFVVDTPGLLVMQRLVDRPGPDDQTAITVSNDRPTAQAFELRIAGDQKLVRSSERLERRDGEYWWTTTVPANSSRSLDVVYRKPL